MRKQKILGLDLGSNSIGWALLESNNDRPGKIIDMGCRIFTKAVEDKTPTPKNAKRRKRRLARRVIQRRKRRKQRMMNYLVKLSLLPEELKTTPQPEIILNSFGDPYQLRAKALDQKLTENELGRVLLHLVQRRGFLSNRKTRLGDMADDPDVLAELEEMDASGGDSAERTGEETQFKKEISALRNTIKKSGYRTLGEYLSTLGDHACKRNRARDEGHLRTDRQMYREELNEIWRKQQKHHTVLTDEVKEQVEEIIFFQRPLKLRADRVGKCSLEPNRNRARMGRLEAQRFRYLQDINNLRWFDPYQEKEISPTDEDRELLIETFENNLKLTPTKIKTTLGLDRRTTLNLDSGVKSFKGNTSACKIREVFPGWNGMGHDKQLALVEDLITIGKKSVLKKRLINHWSFDTSTAVNLCLLEFEPGHSNHSVKAINRLLPFLQDGQIYSEARVSAGYGYEPKEMKNEDRLGPPPEIPNPIVQKGLHELRRVVNAIIAEYGKPDVIRIEMARDLEMNTTRYKQFIAQQKANTRANEEAVEMFKKVKDKDPHLKLSDYPGYDDKIRYRLWKDQGERCAYSGKTIALVTLFSPEIDADHIVPYSQSLDDSYMNKVVCFANENRYKGQRTPIDAFGGNEEKWNQITAAVNRWDKKLRSKKNRFFMTEKDVLKRDFINNQLNDTRYISREALKYLKQLGVDVTATKGFLVSWLRYQWGLNTLLGETNEKERSDHRHHAIDAVVIACIDRGVHQLMAKTAKAVERKKPELKVRDIKVEPPWETLRENVYAALEKIIVSHCPQRKLSGALHEETGVGFIENVGTVYRVDLNRQVKMTQVKKIIDDQVREIVLKHLEKYGANPKDAFAEGVTVYHKDGKTPIKRVRIVQSKTTQTKLEKAKFGVRNRQGDIFKWMAYGNIHHIEIIKNIKTGRCNGKFVTMMEASHRAKGVGYSKQPIIQTNHGPDYQFLMALHINDLVSMEIDEKQKYYRVQKLERSANRIKFRFHTASTLGDKDHELLLTVNTDLIENYKLKNMKINAIGKLLK